MKRARQIFLMLSIGLLFSAFTFLKSDPNEGMAKVNKMHGVEVYFMSEPVREYKIVVESGGIIDNFSVKNVTTNPTAADKASQLVRAAVKKATKDAVEIDAVIYSNAKSAVGVKFTDEASEANKGIALVRKINGVDVYAFSEPLMQYDVVANKAKARTPTAFAGVVNSSIEEDLTKLVKKAQKAAGPRASELDAVVYTTGKSGIGIAYKEE